MGTAEIPTTSPVKAPAPFDDYDSADVILRTSNQFDFHVHKLVLSLASPFFKQMFSLTQPTSPSSPGNNEETLPVIPVDEDHDTIDYLLRLCYPIVDPTPPSDVATVAKILEAAMKYELDEATMLLKGTFLRLIPAEPLRVYANACRLRLENEAGEAAKHWRGHNEPNSSAEGSTIEAGSSVQSGNIGDATWRSTWVEDMKEISAGCLYRLLRFMRTGEIANFCDPPPSPILPAASESPSVDPEILKRCPPDIALRSSDLKLIGTYRAFLAFSGATALLDSAHVSPLVGEPPIVDVDADEATIQNLLKTCEPCSYDIATRKTFTPGELHQLWDVAQKYGMTKMKQAIRLSWTHHIQDTPLRVYFTAKKHGWDSEAERSRARSKDFPLFDKDGYAPEMELVSAKILHELYQSRLPRRGMMKRFR